MTVRKIKSTALICLVQLALCRPGLSACTLWAAAGEAVAGGGTLIAKNRDWVPDHIQELRLVKPDGGIDYFGLFGPAEGGVYMLKAGVNRFGLTVVNAMAITIPAPVRESYPPIADLLVRILAGCRSVEEAVAKREWLTSPGFIMLADRNRIASIEIAPDGKTFVTVLTSGRLAHTNMYLDADLSACNQGRRDVNSEIRLARISELMEGHDKLGLSDFIDFSLDRHGGPDNSVWRTGSRPAWPRTLSSWIVYLPPAGDPELFLRLADPGRPLEELTLRPADIIQAGKYGAD